MVGNVLENARRSPGNFSKIRDRNDFCPFVHSCVHVASFSHLYHTSGQYLLTPIPCQALTYLFFRELLWQPNKNHLHVKGGLRGSLTWKGVFSRGVQGFSSSPTPWGRRSLPSEAVGKWSFAVSHALVSLCEGLVSLQMPSLLCYLMAFFQECILCENHSFCGPTGLHVPQILG